MPAIVVIPARHASTRFPGKPLALLKGTPLIEHVYRNSCNAKLAQGVIIATDHEEIFRTVLAFGGRAVMTSKDHASGTDRIAEVARGMDCDIIVNVQGDEPLIRSEMIDDAISVLDDPDASVGTLAKRISSEREIYDPNVVKVVFDERKFAYYFSRAPIPYHRDLFSAEKRKLRGIEALQENNLTLSVLQSSKSSELFMFKHIGIYSYRKDVLLRLSELPPSRLECIEKLEQLRALEHGMRIKIRETSCETSGVDTPEDLERIEQCLNLSL